MMIICSKNRTHPQFSGVVRNVGEKKWLQRKKVATKRGGGKRGNLSRYVPQTMYIFGAYYCKKRQRNGAYILLLSFLVQKSKGQVKEERSIYRQETQKCW